MALGSATSQKQQKKKGLAGNTSKGKETSGVLDRIVSRPNKAARRLENKT